MNPTLKKILAAVAIKEGIEKVQEMRRPKRSRMSRISPLLGFAALGGAVFYLARSGKLDPLIAKAKGITSSNDEREIVLDESLRVPSSNPS